MGEHNVCSINCLGCRTGISWGGWLNKNRIENEQSSPEGKSSTTPSCDSFLSCMKTSKLCLGTCHTRTLGWLYAVVIFLAVLAVVAVPTLVFMRGAGPGRICKTYDVSMDECWMKLVDVDSPFHWTDSVNIAGSVLAIVAASVGVCGAIYKCRKLLYLVTVLLLISIMCQCLGAGMMGAVVQNDVNSMMTGKMGRRLKDQLYNSLTGYQYDPVIRSAWDSYQVKSCCCGVEGYTDWHPTWTGKEKYPDTCVCVPRNDYPGLGFYCPSGQYRYQSYTSCDEVQDPITMQNLTSKGCFYNMYQDMGNNFKEVMQVGFIVLLALAGTQFLFGIILPTIGLCSCCRSTKPKIKELTQTSEVLTVDSQQLQRADSELLIPGANPTDDGFIDEDDAKPLV